MPVGVTGGYAAIQTPMGLYGQVSGAWLGDARFGRIGRMSAYGQQAIRRTKGDGWAASGEIAWMVPVGGFSLTPFVAADYVDVDRDGYTEVGASVSNVVHADRSFKKLSASVGGEVAMQLGAIRPAMHEGAISGCVVGRGRLDRGDDARASNGIGYASEARFRSPLARARR